MIPGLSLKNSPFAHDLEADAVGQSPGFVCSLAEKRQATRIPGRICLHDADVGIGVEIGEKAMNDLTSDGAGQGISKFNQCGLVVTRGILRVSVYRIASE